MCKRIIALFSSFVILLSCVSVSYAESTGEHTSNYLQASVWDWMMIFGNQWASETPLSGFIQSITGVASGKVCPASSDSLHHGSKTAGFGSGGTDEYGRYYHVICDFCGDPFKVYGSFKRGSGFGGKSDLQQSYDTQVQALPAQGFTSEGNLIWSPSLSDCDGSSFSLVYPWNVHYNFVVPADVSTFTYTERSPSVSYEKLTEHSARVYGSNNSSKCIECLGFYSASWVLPFDCLYRRISSPYLDVSYRDSSGTDHFGSSLYIASSSYSHGTSSSKVYSSSYISLSTLFSSTPSAFLFSFTLYTPQYELIPDTTLTGDTYNINSRPTSITGDYGIIGDNGEITKIEGNTIVNETDNTVYNPVTNTTSNVTDWQYDYSTRTYNLTLDNGTTSTVTYGDENVTIVEGDTTYNVYYLVEDTGTDTPAPCNHSWTETSTTPATCTVPGSRLLTCSLCNETKTEAVPAPGHNWQIKQTVPTEYDNTGQLIQQGYTIFECSVCHEQYKSDDGAAPPGGGSGTDPAVTAKVFGTSWAIFSAPAWAASSACSRLSRVSCWTLSLPWWKCSWSG